MYQSQKPCQTKWYSALAASLKRKAASASSTFAAAPATSPTIHRLSVRRQAAGSYPGAGAQPFTRQNRVAFHSFVAKLR